MNRHYIDLFQYGQYDKRAHYEFHKLVENVSASLRKSYTRQLSSLNLTNAVELIQKEKPSNLEPLLDKFKDDIKEDDQLKKDYKSGKKKKCGDGELHELCSKESM